MLKIGLDEGLGIALLEPDGELTESDFKAAALIIDPYLEKTGKLTGMVIHVKSFPSWDSFSSLVAHLKFVKDHHKKISRIAFSTDSPIGSFAEGVSIHFVNAEIKHFDFDEIGLAKMWATGM